MLSRQPIPTLDRAVFGAASGTQMGAYVLKCAGGADGSPDLILIAIGSEVPLIVSAFDLLLAKGVKPRIVSMPSMNLFERQSQEYKDSVLPPHIRARVAVEFAGDFGWFKYVGLDGQFVGMNTFGESAPLRRLLEKFNFTPDRVAEVAMSVYTKQQQ